MVTLFFLIAGLLLVLGISNSVSKSDSNQEHYTREIHAKNDEIHLLKQKIETLVKQLNETNDVLFKKTIILDQYSKNNSKKKKTNVPSELL